MGSICMCVSGYPRGWWVLWGGLREGMVGGWGLFADDGGFLMFLQRGVEVTVSRYGG